MKTLDRIVQQLAEINCGQHECNRLLDRISFGLSPVNLEYPDRIKQLEEELTEANEKLASTTMCQLDDPFSGEARIGKFTLAYWANLIRTHVNDEKFNSLEHAITHLVDKYPNRKEG